MTGIKLPLPSELPSEVPFDRTDTPPTVIQALAAVMADVQGIGKSDKNTQQGYMFRGIDAITNRVGPAFRTHGVIAVPTKVECDSEHYTTKNGTPMRGITLTVSFRFYGLAGDYIDAQVCGEASDSGDKAVPKAHSVAYRTLLLQALCIPTDEPDPDSQSHERGAKPRADSSAKTATDDIETHEQFANLTKKLLAAAEKLGALPATKEAIAKNAAIGDRAGHIAWLQRCLATAEENLAERERSEASPFKGPPEKKGEK